MSELVNVDESTPVVRNQMQTETYRLTKAIAEDLVLAANRRHQSKMQTVSIRPAGMFGEGDVQIIPAMMKAYETGKTIFQLGRNDNLFDFTHVTNVAHAHILAAEILVRNHNLSFQSSSLSLNDKRVDGEAFFITNDDPVFFWDFVRRVWAAAGETNSTRDV